jgi:hypothetical protein
MTKHWISQLYALEGGLEMKKTFALNRALFAVILVLTALLVSGVVFAATDVPLLNGDFGTSFTPLDWDVANPPPDCSGGVGVRDTSTGYGTNGSALLTIAASDTCAGIVQCVPITSEATHQYAGVNGYITSTASAFIQIDAFSDATCTTATDEDNTATSNSVIGGGWQLASTTISHGAIGVPDTGGSVKITLYLLGDPDDQAWFDDVTTYQSDHPTAVTLRDLTAQAQASAVWLLPVALLVAVSGVWFMARRRRT